MDRAQVQSLIDRLAFPYETQSASLIETHISWVILTDHYVYKIKRPVHYSFLDFTLKDQRLVMLQRELYLNRRLAGDMYLDILPIVERDGDLHIVKEPGVPSVEHALLMKRMDEKRQLDILIENDEVSSRDIKVVADVLIPFHQGADRIVEGDTAQVLWEELSDILSVKPQLIRLIGTDDFELLKRIITSSKGHIFNLENHLRRRHEKGFIIDGHGDLHCRNILMTDPPIIFDCIEFNDEFRQIDVLSEIAFLCMDLERIGREDLSKSFLTHYLKSIACIESPLDVKLFAFYKLHRAGVQLKVRAINSAS